MNETNEKTKFDITQPFVAIVLNDVDGGYFDRTHAVYLVNPLDVPLRNVRETVGGFFSTEESVIQADEKTAPAFDLDAHAAHLLEHSSSDEFDELDCWWSIAYELNGQQQTRNFDAGKALRATQSVENCPVLNRGARIVGR